MDQGEEGCQDASVVEDDTVICVVEFLIGAAIINFIRRITNVEHGDGTRGA